MFFMPHPSDGIQKPKRVLAFARVSGNDLDAGKNEQHADRVARLKEQLARLDAYALAMGWPKAIHFSEIESGGEKYEQDVEGLGLDDFLSRPRGQHRKEQRKLLNDLRAGDVVLVTKSDRWSRDARFDADAADFIRARKARWHSLQEPWLWDAPTMVRGMVGLSKEQERDTIRERMVGARQRQRDAGEYTEGLPPFGYRRAHRVGAKLADRFLHKHEQYAQLVVECFDRCVRGESVLALTNWLTSQSVPGRGDKPRTFDKKTINVMLRSRAYLGEIKNSKGEWIKAHEPIVDRGVWARAQAALNERRLGGEGRKPGEDRHARNANWVLRGIATCALCGRRMGSVYAGGTRTKGGGREYGRNYYGCNGRLADKTCAAPYCLVPVADAAVCELALDYLGEQRKHLLAKKPTKTSAHNFEAVREKLAARRARVLDMFESGDIDATERKARLEKITAEITQLEAEEADAHAIMQAHDPKLRADVLAELGALERAWDRLTPIERRGVISRLAKSVTINASAKELVRVDWYTPEELTLRAATGKVA